MADSAAKEAAIAIVKRLRAHGHQALLAGGCVRDTLLGHEPKDYDVATDAQPAEVIRLFRRTQQVGVQFGVVIVNQRGHWVEVATFRSDLGYEDGRHPTDVVFSTPQEDAARRDFTINGMFYDPVEQCVIDYVGGQEDLSRRIIRAIGDPAQRIAEDHLRMLRAIRFASRLRFEIDSATYEAIRKHAPRISEVSAERIREELELILRDPNRSWGFRQTWQAGLLAHLWPQASWSHEQVERAAAVLTALPDEISLGLALAAMLHERDVGRLDRICRHLACSNEVRNAVVWLIRRKDVLADPDVLTLADLKLLKARPEFNDLLLLFRALRQATREPLAPYEAIRTRAEAIPEDQVSPQPLMNGEDLLAMGIEQGPAVGQILERVYYAQLNEEIRTRQEALAMARCIAGL